MKGQGAKVKGHGVRGREQELESKNKYLPSTLHNKLTHLQAVLKDMDSVLVAFSGGVDSTFLLKVAADTLKDKTAALTAISPTYPEREFEEAKRLVLEIGVKHIVVDSNELLIPGFAENSDKRCFYCKSELFDLCVQKAKDLGFLHVADGSNIDDLNDYRPGKEAAKQLGVRSPLIEAGLSKLEIRELSRELRLETWKKPSFACLSSRFPYGTKITEERLEKINSCEELLRDLGFSQFRVRYHNEIARIEVLPEEIDKFFSKEIRDAVVSGFKKQGFTYVALDLQGYRTGSMNEKKFGELN